MGDLRRLFALSGVVLLLASGCAYRYYAEDLKPLDEAQQGEGKAVADDGTVTFTQGRLEIGLRPMTDEELNRQFGKEGGAQSINPYTFANSTVFRTNETPHRFTVFRVRVENYEYPKVYLNPAKLYITTQNGRKYYALTREQLEIYYRAYMGGGDGGDNPGAPGNTYQIWKERSAQMRRSLFPDQQVFSAQEAQGYVVFEPLAVDVSELTLHVPDLAIRFDYKGDPVESIDVTAKYNRVTGRVYPDGRKELTQR